MNPPENLLDATESVLATLKELHIDAVVMGAVAMAAHHYVRFSERI